MLIGGVWDADGGGDRALATVSTGRAGATLSCGGDREPCFAACHPNSLAEWGRLRVAGDLRLAGRHDLATSLGIAPQIAVGLFDAELLLRAWEAWGTATLARLDGEFAFALWDGSQGELVLARDILGQRPLHVARRGRALIFGSRPMPLASAIGRPAADVNQLVTLLAILPEAGNASFIAGVERIPPAEALIVSTLGQRVVRYWDCEGPPLRISRADALARVGSEIDRAVANIPQQDVMATQLSGGLDSSLVAESLARQRSGRIVSITGAADQPDEDLGNRFDDETVVAAATADFLGIEHVIARASAESPLDALERWLPTSQRPLLNPCNLGWIDATYAAAADIGSPILLNGLTGNFTVSHEGLSRLAALARRGHFLRFSREIALYRRYTGARWRGAAALGLGWALPAAVFQRVAQWKGHSRPPFEERSFLRRHHPAVVLARSELVRQGLEPNARLQPDDGPGPTLSELRFNDPGLANSSLTSRYGVASIDPLGSRRLIELCLRLPSDHFFYDGQPRRVARSLLAGRVPDQVVNERRRGYQGSNWRRGAEGALDQLIAEVDLAAGDGDSNGLFDLPTIRGMLTSWPTDGWNAEAQVQRYRRDLIRAVAGLRWMRWVREEGRG